MENSLAVPQKLNKHRATIAPEISFLGTYSKELKTCARTDNLYMTIHCYYSKKWKEPKYPSLEWKNRM